jgi:hypothetical protein
MTDEPREDLQPEEEDVEGHAPPLNAPPLTEKFGQDEDDDVEAHSPPLNAPPLNAPPIS